MFLVWGNGAANISPAQLIIRANGDGAWFGWPNSLQVETEVAAWYDAKTLDEEEGRSAPTEPGCLLPRGLRPPRLLPALSSLAQGRDRHRAESAGVLLGGE